MNKNITTLLLLLFLPFCLFPQGSHKAGQFPKTNSTTSANRQLRERGFPASQGTSSRRQKNNNLQVEQYQLENGLTVYLNPDPSARRVFGAVAVNAGSKNDPADATGIAHYLEHLLFKGTDKLGTWDYEKEKIHLDSITILYEELGQTGNEEKRQKIQVKINEQSVAAAQYALPNDFDNLLKSIGATDVNAFTSPDMTFYHNAFPATQLQKWLDIISHRFENPVFRSFQSELEVVYEEKNKAMDEFGYGLFEVFMEKIFEPHPYGTQTTLGKTRHLKNPNLREMYVFFKKYYVPNNMALIITGNFDAEQAKPWIENTFGKWEEKPTPEKIKFPIKKINGREKTTVRQTPVKVAAYGYKTVGSIHPDQAALTVVSKLLSNDGGTGLFDQLNQNNKLTHLELIYEPLNDDGVAVFVVVPKVLRQSFRRAEKWVFGAVDKVKEGDFPAGLLASVKYEIIQSFQKELEDVTERGINIGYSFNQGISWQEYLRFTEKIKMVSKEDVMRVAEKYYGKHFINLRSRMGFPKKEKLKKPGFRAGKPDTEKTSDYAHYFKTLPQGYATPDFLNFKEDVTYLDLKNNNRLYVTPNPINDIFTITIQYQYGNDKERDLQLAARMMGNAGTVSKSMSELKKAFSAIGARYEVWSSRNYLNIELEGSEERLAEALQLLNELVHQPTIGKEAIKIATKEARTRKRLEKRDPSVMGRALRSYASHGSSSYFLRRHSIPEIKKADGDKMVRLFKNATKYAANIHYVGTLPPHAFRDLFLEHFDLDESGNREPLIFPQPLRYKNNQIYFVHDKNALQSQVYFYVAGDPYKKEDYAKYQAFNSYFGDGFSGLVLQEIREYRSLAYSAWGRYFHPLKPGKRAYLSAFVGCQADKTNESIDVMMQLLDSLPERPGAMPRIRSGMRLKAHTQSPPFRMRSRYVVGYQRMGYRKSPLELAYPAYGEMELDDIMRFHEEHVKGKPVVITIYGDKQRADLKALERYGKVTLLKRKDIVVF